MVKVMRSRFWLETGLGTITGILFMITLMWRDWIEIVFGINPDSGKGWLEWLTVGVLSLVTITLFVLARYEWRRVRTTLGYHSQ